MLKEIAIGLLKPNPYRRLDEYPIVRDKVDALRESFRATGFWGNIRARPAGKEYEIAFGHHRLIALQEEYGEGVKVEVKVDDLTNEQMLKMMARENSQEYGSSAWVEMETLRAVIDAYGKGEIQLPAPHSDTPKKHIRNVPQPIGERPFTMAGIAAFVGWTRKSGAEPNHACEVAFKAMDMIDAGFLKQSDLKGLQREHVNQLVTSQWSIYQANMRAADQAAKDAAAADKAATEAEDARERKRLEKKADVLREQAEQGRQKAKADAKDFGKESAKLLREGASVREIREKAEQRKPSVTNPRTIDLDGLARKTEDALSRIANGDDVLSANMAIVKKHIDDVSGDAIASLDKAFEQAALRLQSMRKAFKVRV